MIKQVLAAEKVINRKREEKPLVLHVETKKRISRLSTNLDDDRKIEKPTMVIEEMPLLVCELKEVPRRREVAEGDITQEVVEENQTDWDQLLSLIHI